MNSNIITEVLLPIAIYYVVLGVLIYSVITLFYEYQNENGRKDIISIVLFKIIYTILILYLIRLGIVLLDDVFDGTNKYNLRENIKNVFEINNHIFNDSKFKDYIKDYYHGFKMIVVWLVFIYYVFIFLSIVYVFFITYKKLKEDRMNNSGAIELLASSFMGISSIALFNYLIITSLQLAFINTSALQEQLKNKIGEMF